LCALSCAPPAAEPEPEVPRAQSPTREWRHRRSKLVVALGSARHSANDVLAGAGARPIARAKFTYGKVSKDLQDEEVSLWIRRPETTWTRVGSALTDSDGWAAIAIPPETLQVSIGGVGRGELLFVVEGDHSRTSSELWLFERGTPAVVFDIDGTLTTGDAELIKETLLGADIVMRAHADVVTKRWASAGILPIYLTGRPYLFSPATRAWLARHGFPAGPLITADHITSALPSESRVGAFKSDWLGHLSQQLGVKLVAAYGNSDTDVCAFARAGIPGDWTFVLGRSGEVPCGDSPPASGIVEFGLHRELPLPPAN